MPAFNEGSKIGDLITSMPSDVHGHSIELMVVDDGSTDDTVEVALSRGATVLTTRVNGGKGSALQRGMAYVATLGFDAIVWMDSDGQHRPESLTLLTAPVLLGDAGMVVGSRYLSPSASKAPLNRRVVRRSAIGAIHRITGCRLTDPFSGFRCFSPEAAEVVDLRGNGYESELEACFAVNRAGFEVIEVPIPRIYGPDTSKMGHRHGDLLGRLVVVGGYARTVFNAWMSKGATPESRVRV